MITQFANFNASKNNWSKLEISNVIIPKKAFYQNNISLRSKNASNIAFTSYHGADWYGTSDSRASLAYRVQLTPGKIDATMSAAHTRSKGILENYKTLAQEAAKVKVAFKSFFEINKEYRSVARSRAEDLIKRNPEGSGIPFVGIGPQAAAVLSGEFVQEIRGHVNDLIEDYPAIRSKYYFDGLKPIVDGYSRASEHLIIVIDPTGAIRNRLTEEIEREKAIVANEYSKKHAKNEPHWFLGNIFKTHRLKREETAAIIEIENRPRGIRPIEKLISKILRSKKTFEEHLSRAHAGMEKAEKLVRSKLPGIVGHQDDRQAKRLFKKGVIKIISCGFL